MRVELASVADISQIVKVVSTMGLEVDASMIRAYFFGSPCVDWDATARGGFVVKNDANQIVGYFGLSPCNIYFAQKKYQAYQMGVLGILPGYGAAMFDIMDRVVDLTKSALIYSNTANTKSGKLWTEYGGFNYGPPSCAVCQYDFTGLGALTSLLPYEPTAFSIGEVRDILENKLLYGSGPRTERCAERLQWLYGGHMGLRSFVPIVVKESYGVGYAVVCSKPFREFPIRRFEVMDLVAIGDENRICKALANKVMRYAATHGGVVVEYIGNRKIFHLSRSIPANPYIWKTGIPEISEALSNAPLSFFGPYDGDRSLG